MTIKRKCETAKFMDSLKLAGNMATLFLLGPAGLSVFGMSLDTCECGRCSPPDEWSDLGEAGA